jgi:AAA domain
MAEMGPWHQPDPPYYECIAVSTSSDTTGSYNRYAFGFQQIPDFDKLAIWPDAYYMTFNRFQQDICALDRSKMLAGQNASIQCFSSNYLGSPKLPADLDGSTPPPTGSPNYIVQAPLNGTTLNIWKFHVDFATPTNSTLAGPIAISVAPFSTVCDTCVPQLGTTWLLDGDIGLLTYRLAYRNFGAFESLVTDQAVANGRGQSGIRWYELRNPGGNLPTVYQQGTYVPDSLYRFMSSIAMDRVGDIAVGYSVSSSAMHPGIRFTGRVPADALGTLEGETTIVDGAGSQTTARWGDYSSMSIDPVDDCTFWYTNEYLQEDGLNWHTRIASFRFPSCGAAVGATSPTSLSFAPQPVGTASPSKGVVLANDSNFQMDAPSVVVTGDFALQTNSCTSGVKPRTHCDVTIVFKPKAPGPRAGTLTFTDNATNSPQLVSLSGTGTQVKLSATSIVFNTRVIGTTSSPRIVSFANRADKDLIKAALKKHSALFNTAGAHVDTSVGNPARILRVPGTLNRKGENTAERPWRECAILESGNRGGRCLDRENLMYILALEDTPIVPITANPEAVEKSVKWLREFLGWAGVDWQEKKGGTDNPYVFVIEDDLCPNSEEHSAGGDSSVALLVKSDGNLALACQHSHCKETGKATWKLFRAQQEKRKGEAYLSGGVVGFAPSPKGGVEEVELISFANIEPKPIDWVWKGYLPKGKIIMFNGEPGEGKSLAVLDIAARLTTGADFPDGSKNTSQPMGVLILSVEEDPADTILPRFMAAARSPNGCVAQGCH